MKIELDIPDGLAEKLLGIPTRTSRVYLDHYLPNLPEAHLLVITQDAIRARVDES